MDFLLTSDKTQEYLDIAKNSVWRSKSIFHSGALVFSILAKYYEVDTLLQSQGDNFSTHIFQITLPSTKIQNYYDGTLTPQEQKAWKKCGRKVVHSNKSLMVTLPKYLEQHPDEKIAIFIDKHRGKADWIIPFISHPNIKLVAIKNIGKTGLKLGNKVEKDCIKKLASQTTYFANTDEPVFQKYKAVDNKLCATIPEWKSYSQKYPLGCGLAFFSIQPPKFIFPSIGKKPKVENRVDEVDEVDEVFQLLEEEAMELERQLNLIN